MSARNIGLVFGICVALDLKSLVLMALVSAVAGAVGGLIFWLLVSPPTRPEYAALVGEILAVVVPLVEIGVEELIGRK